MSCDVGEVMERLENEPFCHFTYVTTHSPTLPFLYLRNSSFSNHSVASSTSQFILQPFFRFSYVTSPSLNTPGEPPMERAIMAGEHTWYLQDPQCGPVRFHYACLLPCRWQYRYVTTMLPGFARNVFYGGCSVFIWVPLIQRIPNTTRGYRRLSLVTLAARPAHKRVRILTLLSNTHSLISV